MESRRVKNETDISDDRFESVIVSHDLQDCLDESFDMCFNKVYEQLPIINYSKISDETERPENTTYIGKLQGHDENTGLVLKKYNVGKILFCPNLVIQVSKIS